jgi:hypothetical protein
MKPYFRYQKGYLYEEYGAWYVRYRQRVPQEDGSSKLKHISKHLGRSKDFFNIFAVERCRASFMQTVNIVKGFAEPDRSSFSRPSHERTLAQLESDMYIQREHTRVESRPNGWLTAKFRSKEAIC